MAAALAPSVRRGETAAHARLKKLAAFWAQAHGYSACAMEVALPKCRYRADVAAYRPQPGALGRTAIFECKQARPDLRKDSARSEETRTRLATVDRRREILERNLRVHHPTLRTGDSLFPEWESRDFTALEHRGYARVRREMAALQNRLEGGTKFETLGRYRCANLFFLVVSAGFWREPETPIGWGVLIERGDALALARQPVWHDSSDEMRLRVLQKIAAGGTRGLNQKLGITFDDLQAARCGL